MRGRCQGQELAGKEGTEELRSEPSILRQSLGPWDGDAETGDVCWGLRADSLAPGRDAVLKESGGEDGAGRVPAMSLWPPQTHKATHTYGHTTHTTKALESDTWGEKGLRNRAANPTRSANPRIGQEKRSLGEHMK